MMSKWLEPMVTHFDLSLFLFFTAVAFCEELLDRSSFLAFVFFEVYLVCRRFAVCPEKREERRAQLPMASYIYRL